MDDLNREALGSVLEQLVEMNGKPTAIRVDNGSELTSSAFTEWCEAQGIDLRFHRAPQAG